MTDLIARVEAATGPDREIDQAIFHDVLRFCRHAKKTRLGAQGDIGFECDDCGADSWGNLGKMGQHLHDAAPPYTASIDAALTLVPDGWKVDLSNVCSPGWFAGIYETNKYGEAHARAASPALALCAAALKARTS